ncbi:hypothetical protein MRX96_049619 [Rhipicephalus microplus]
MKVVQAHVQADFRLRSAARRLRQRSFLTSIQWCDARCCFSIFSCGSWGPFFMLAGALFLVESLEFEEDERILENLDFPGTLLSHLEVLLFSFGLALFTVSSCGCIRALRENTFLLNMYSHALTLLILINFVLGVFCITVVIRTTLSERLVVQYRDASDIENLVDAVQRYLKCCGMTHRNFRDWENNISYFHCNLSNPSHERCSVPASCCRADSSYTGIFCGRDVLNLSDHEAWFRVHTGSCPDAANRFLKEHVHDHWWRLPHRRHRVGLHRYGHERRDR